MGKLEGWCPAAALADELEDVWKREEDADQEQDVATGKAEGRARVALERALYLVRPRTHDGALAQLALIEGRLALLLQLDTNSDMVQDEGELILGALRRIADYLAADTLPPAICARYIGPEAATWRRPVPRET